MSNIPDFAKGAAFSIDTTPDRPQQQQLSQNRGRDSSRGGGNFTPRQFHHQNRRGNPGHFTPRCYSGTPRPHSSPSTFQRPQRFPRQPNFNNPYEQPLTPRNYGPRQQRWQYTPRGGGTPLSTEFGPAAEGCSLETRRIIDDFVKPTMDRDPWQDLISRRLQGPSPSKKQKPELPEEKEDDAVDGTFDINEYLPPTH